jgi:hypothetical protein
MNRHYLYCIFEFPCDHSSTFYALHCKPMMALFHIAFRPRISRDLDVPLLFESGPLEPFVTPDCHCTRAGVAFPRLLNRVSRRNPSTIMSTCRQQPSESISARESLFRFDCQSFLIKPFRDIPFGYPGACRVSKLTRVDRIS